MRSAICTSGEPVSPFFCANSSIIFCLSSGRSNLLTALAIVYDYNVTRHLFQQNLIMRKLRRKANFRLILTSSLIFTAIAVIFFIPPSNLLIKIFFISLLSLISYLLSSIFLKPKFSLVITLFLTSNFLLLSSNLKDPLNFVLLASLFVGIVVLIK